MSYTSNDILSFQGNKLNLLTNYVPPILELRSGNIYHTRKKKYEKKMGQDQYLYVNRYIQNVVANPNYDKHLNSILSNTNLYTESSYLLVLDNNQELENAELNQGLYTTGFIVFGLSLLIGALGS